ncbi:MAG TPA: Uma2 family endonuclease [Micromonosporaceae bacterium]|nr:Uma2 family endonuclease [Micromonosporaceae bacterium]
MTAAPLLPQRVEWTVDDLAELPPDLNYELINGRLILPSATPFHQDLCGEVWMALRVNCPPEYIVSIDQSLKVDRRNEPRPDVVALHVKHLNRSPVPVQDAIIAVEVISPDSNFRDMVEKAKIYGGATIPTYWVIDPSKDDISLTEFVLQPAEGRYAIGRHTLDVFTSETPWPVTVDLPALSARRAAMLEQIDPG